MCNVGGSSGPQLAALRGANGSETRRALSLLTFEDRHGARSIGIQHKLLPEDHPLWSKDTDDSADASLSWPLGQAGRVWLESLGEQDVEKVLRSLAAQRMNLDLGVADFVPTALRRKETIPLTSFSELFGME